MLNFNKDELIKKAKEIAGKTNVYVSDKADKLSGFLEEKQYDFELALRLKTVEKALSELYCEFGRLMYESMITDERPAYEKTMLDTLMEKISELEVEKTEIAALLEKPETKAVKEDAEKPCDEDVKPIYCGKCGAENDKDDAFCTKCGKKMRK